MQAPGGPEDGFKYGGWNAKRKVLTSSFHGSGHLIQTLLKHDLVDELWLLIHPLTLGTGKKLFDDVTIPTAFTLLESTATPSGVIVAHYKRAGEVKTGTMGA